MGRGDRMSVHVVPRNDLVDHPLDVDCLCGPDVGYIDPDTGETYPSGPVVLHHSLDGREAREAAPDAAK